jgi:hypothetical protein
MNAQDAIALFLQERPSLRECVRHDPEHGLMMNLEATEAFIDWSVGKGLSTPAQAAETRWLMDKSRRAARLDSN